MKLGLVAALVPACCSTEESNSSCRVARTLAASTLWLNELYTFKVDFVKAHYQHSCPLALLTQAPMSASDCSWLLQRVRMRMKGQMRCDMQCECEGIKKGTLSWKKKTIERADAW